MSDIVERVAAAIADKQHRLEATFNLEQISHPVTEAAIYAFGPAKVTHTHREMARAAIEAMHAAPVRAD